MPIRWTTKPGAYQDSVSLMQISTKVTGAPGIRNAAAVMCTPMNRETLQTSGLLVPELQSAGPNDLVVVVDAETDEAAEAAMEQIEKLLAAPVQSTAQNEGSAPTPKSAQQALAQLPSANMALISVPGTYAAYEAGRALRLGLHVHLFSDNVPVEAEIELKQYAASKGLLMMGPDCGTAIIAGTPLGFANLVRRGPIGVVGASGTGIQAVTVLCDRLGSGISHAIGTGGRDLSDRIGGIMFLAGLEALEADAGTEVILLVSKPPGKETMARVLARVSTCKKPVVVCLLRGDAALAAKAGAHPAADLEEAARLAVSLASGGSIQPMAADAETTRAAAQAAAQLSPERRYLRGLFSGGTLCDEAMLLLKKRSILTWSNVPVTEGYGLQSGQQSKEHTVIDLGEDEFTRGKPHPMIDPSIRNQRIIRELADPAVAVILVDVVLGYGSHADPAGAVVEAVKAGREASGNRETLVIAAVCGTEGDPQSLSVQEEKLRTVGVYVYPSSAAAALAAEAILNRRGSHE
jgi:FdrA protein